MISLRTQKDNLGKYKFPHLSQGIPEIQKQNNQKSKTRWKCQEDFWAVFNDEF